MSSAGFDAEAIPGSKGQYDVVADGRPVFSKADTGRFPEDGEVLTALQG